jgi:hypothetical protein
MGPLLGALFSIVVAQAMPGWSVVLDPATAHASSVHWTISLSAHYCGGYVVGDGVYVQLEAPFAFPNTVQDEDVLFAGNAAVTSLDNGILRVAQAPDVARSMLCTQGERPLTIELLPSLGLTNPDSGTYAVDVWTGSNATVNQLPLTVNDPSAAEPALAD